MKITKAKAFGHGTVWVESSAGECVPLPLDVSVVSDTQMQIAVHAWFSQDGREAPPVDPQFIRRMRAAIAALAAALGEEG